MRFLQYLNEKYDGRITSSEFFVNPSRKEFKELKTDTIRFVAFPEEKKVYIFDGRSVIHYQAYEDYFKIPWKRRYNHLLGVAEMKGGKPVMVSSDEFEVSTRREKKKWCWILDQDWSWLERFISIKNWLNKNTSDLESTCSNYG